MAGFFVLWWQHDQKTYPYSCADAVKHSAYQWPYWFLYQP